MSSVVEDAEENHIAEKISTIINHLNAEKTAILTQFQRREMPNDREFYMHTFDADEQFEEAIAFLTRFGFVCLKNMVSEEKRMCMHSRINNWLESLQTGLDCSDMSSFTNSRMPDNFSNGVLDGIAPQTTNNDENFVTTSDKIMAKALGQSRNNVEVVGDVHSTLFRCGKTPKSILNRENGNDVHAVVANDNIISRNFVSRVPIYSVVREAPGNDDEFDTELQTVSDLRYRFDTLTNSQEAWNVRTDPKIYRFFRSLLQGGDDLLVSIDRFIYQRPILSRPKGSTEDWKNNYEHRPTWEHNPFWKGDPLSISSVASASVSSLKGQKILNKMQDGSLFMAQSNRQAGKKRKRGEEHKEGKDDFRLPFFTGYQGILAITDMTLEGGAVNLVPAFHTVYEDYANAHRQEWSGIVENLVHVQKKDTMAENLILKNAVSVAMRAGTMLIYDKRIPRWGTPNRREKTPAVAMFISMWPREPSFDAAYKRVRALSVRYGIRCTAMRHLTGHSSTSPRWKREFPLEIYLNYTMPLFTELGLCLLGVRAYNKRVVEEAIKE